MSQTIQDPLSEDLEAARKRFWISLAETPNIGVNPRAVARMLASTSFGLKDFGVQVFHPLDEQDQAHQPKTETVEWQALRRCVRYHLVEDAMPVFRAMATCLAERPMVEAVSLMREVLAQPWRLEAMEAEPAFFLKTRTDTEQVNYAVERTPANALQALASLGSAVEISHEETLDAICALKRLGVQDFPNPNNGESCLHLAAFHRPAPSLQAFIQEFPGSLEATKAFMGYSPLHQAASSFLFDNVKVLLDAGVQPHPVSTNGTTPLRLAALNRRLNSVLFLVETGAYNEKDVWEAGTKFSGAEREKVMALHLAVKARQNIENTDRLHPGLRPL